MVTDTDKQKAIEISTWLSRQQGTETAAIKMAAFKNHQIKNHEQSLLWTLYSILDKIAIEGEARDIAIKEFKDHLINKNLE